MLSNLTAAPWTMSDEVLLLNFIHEHCAALGDVGVTSRWLLSWQAAVAILEA